jgi:hypothetical protein
VSLETIRSGGPNEAVSARYLTAQGTVRARHVPPVSAARPMRRRYGPARFQDPGGWA